MSNVYTPMTQATTAVSGIAMPIFGGSAIAGLPVLARVRTGADVAKHTQGTSVWSPPT